MAPTSLPAWTFAVRSLVTPLTIETFESSVRREDHHGGLPFVAERVDQRAKLRAVEPVDLYGEDFYALDVASLRFQIAGLALGDFGLELLELVLERFFARLQFFQVDARVLGLLLQSFLEAVQGAFAGDGFDAAYAG